MPTIMNFGPCLLRIKIITIRGSNKYCLFFFLDLSNKYCLLSSSHLCMLHGMGVTSITAGSSVIFNELWLV